MFLKIGTRFVTDTNYQIRVVGRKITGYFIGVPGVTTPAFVAVASGDDVAVGGFTNGGIFNKIITS